MEIKKLTQPGFEEIVACSDPDSGLRAIIGIHNTRLGPALGGIRMLPYSSEAEALEDVTRLAKAMTYKAAAAGLKLGGGKAVIIANPITQKTTPLLQAMGKFINQLKGRYIAAKDAGITTADLVILAKETSYVTGLPEEMGGSGDPSPWTAIGILEGLRVCIQYQLKRKSFSGLKVMIQGVGHVGLGLAKLLAQEKAKLFISDVNREALEQTAKTLKAEIIQPEEVYSVKTDIFSPCALGGVINDRTLDQLQCSIIAGGANNQLADESKHGPLLLKKGILYAPDYVLNAGGLINIYVKDILKRKDSRPWIKQISETLLEIFKLSAAKKIGTAQAANLMTEKIIF